MTLLDGSLTAAIVIHPTENRYENTKRQLTKSLAHFVMMFKGSELVLSWVEVSSAKFKR